MTVSTPWEVVFTDEAKADYMSLDRTVQRRVAKVLRRVAQNPLPSTEGGYGKPLGHHGDGNLSGLLKVKLRAEGVRIVYRLERAEGVMRVVVVGARANDSVYHEAARRRRQHDL